MEEKIKKNKKEWTVGGVIKTVIIAILALLMVGGSFYYIFAPGFKEDANAFGYYDGEPVLYENNNVFGRTLASDENYLTAATTGDYNTLWTSFYSAYQAQVVYMALSDLADDAGIIAPDSLVSKMAIESGAFNNENGEFDQSIFDSISDLDKRTYLNYLKEAYPYQRVLDDVYSAISSSKEREFVINAVSAARTFDYFVVGPNAYPDSDTIDYINENRGDFIFVDASMISFASEDSAKKCYEELKNGLSWSDAVTTYSTDAYATSDGYIGGAMLSGIFKSNLADVADLEKITSLKKDEYTEPVNGLYAWTIYKLNEDSYDINVNSDEDLYRAKSMIYTDNPDLIQPYIENSIDVATNYAKNNFEYANELFGTGIASVGPATNNVGSSSIVYGIESSDTYGYLAEAVANDEDLYKALFTEAVGYVAGPIEIDGSYLFVKVADAYESEDLGALTGTFYDYYQNQFNVVDAENNVLMSDKHEDNFTTRFIELFLGSSL